MAVNALPDYSNITTPLLRNYGSNNALQQQQYGQAANSLSQPLDFSKTPGLMGLGSSDQAGRDQMTDSVYGQQTRFLDPQFQQGQSDLTSRLANQGIMQGSDAYNREMSNFDLQKTAAYGDARDRAIQQGGAEQSRMFGLSLQGRNQGINETLAERNAPLASLQALNGIGTAQSNGLFGAQNGTYNAQLGNANANAAQQSNFNNGLFGLGSAALQNPQAIKDGWNFVSNLWG